MQHVKNVDAFLDYLSSVHKRTGRVMDCIPFAFRLDIAPTWRRFPLILTEAAETAAECLLVSWHESLCRKNNKKALSALFPLPQWKSVESDAR